MLFKVATLALVWVLACSFFSLVSVDYLERQSSAAILECKEDVQSSEKIEHEIAGLIRQLGESQFVLREGARKRLAQIGIAALPQLREAWINTTDLEVRRHCEALVKDVEEQEVTSGIIKAGEVDFCAVSNRVWRIPKKGAVTNVSLGIRFENKSRGKTLFFVHDTIHITLTNALGEEVKRDGGRDRWQKDPVAYSPALNLDENYTFFFADAKLCWNKWDKDANDLWLVYVDRDTCEHRYFKGLSTGKYFVSIRHKNKWNSSPEITSRLWVGEVSTYPVEVEIK